MAKVISFTEYFLPGFRGGGTIVSLSRILQQSTEQEHFVFTRNHDLGDPQVYPDVDAQRWMQMDNVEVAYLRPGLRDLTWMVKEIRRIKPDLYYVNSLQSPDYSILPYILRFLRVIPRAKLLVAPRGECSIGARSHKALKKRVARPFLNWILNRDALWHVSSSRELDEVEAWRGRKVESDRVVIQGDPAATASQEPSEGSGAEVPVVVFASRIDQMKGLDIAIQCLQEVTSPCKFRVYGSISDQSFWERCLVQVAHLPSQIVFEYMDSYDHASVQLIFSDADIFLFPTRGENFGHAIAEALSVGCPVEISQNTIWTEFINENNCGYAGSFEGLVEYLDTFLASETKERQKQRVKIHDAYRKWCAENESVADLFSGALKGPRESL